MTHADWIAIDWGTTHMRAWAMQGRSPVAHLSSDKGMNSLSQEQFEPTLVALIDPWLNTATTDVVCCGMVGSRQGWVEAPYAAVPCNASQSTMVQAPTSDARIRVHVLPGLSQAEPADVMRGEETQIAGFLALNPSWDGVICLPGTHSKWAQVSAGEVVSFQTFMTGEMFALLSGHSVLRHSTQSTDWDAGAFQSGLSDAMSRPEALAARLFRLRAAHLLHATDAAASRARLSGLLIGSELAAAKPYWLGQQVAVIGADALATHYVDALAAQSVPATHAKAEAMTLAGLTAAYRSLSSA
ncbi:MAG: 2-dehydro-3-deoxygalactonokinase [Paracoccaceae bacterium]